MRARAQRSSRAGGPGAAERRRTSAHPPPERQSAATRQTAAFLTMPSAHTYSKQTWNSELCVQARPEAGVVALEPVGRGRLLVVCGGTAASGTSLVTTGSLQPEPNVPTGQLPCSSLSTPVQAPDRTAYTLLQEALASSFARHSLVLMVQVTQACSGNQCACCKAHTPGLKGRARGGESKRGAGREREIGGRGDRRQRKKR